MWRSISLLLLVIAPSACREPQEPAPETSPAPEAALDPVGRMMLDPLRVEALQPEALVKRLALAPDATIADIGAGPGFLTLYFARAVPRGVVIATDLNASFLAVTEKRARAAGLTNVKTRAVEAEHPGLEAGTIDVAVLCQVDHFLRDRTAYFRELTAALRPQGRVVVINANRHLEAASRALDEASLELVDRWAPSGAYTVLVARKR